jgi:hypothetical protein
VPLPVSSFDNNSKKAIKKELKGAITGKWHAKIR